MNNIIISKKISKMIRLKLQKFKKDIRKKELQSYFFSRRNQMTSQTHQIPTNNHLQAQTNQDNEVQLLDKWKNDQRNLQNYLKMSDYERIIIVIKDIASHFKKMNQVKNDLYSKKQRLLVIFYSQTDILNLLIKIVVQAHKEIVSTGIFQNLSTNSIYILLHLLLCRSLHFQQQFFLQEDVLLFLRLCINEPKVDVKHLSNMIEILSEIIRLSEKGSGVLFRRLNNFQNQIFHFGAIFYNITKCQLQPSDVLTINFIIFIKFYFQYIENSQFSSKNLKDPTLSLQPSLTRDQKNICFEITINSVHHFMQEDYFQDNQIYLNLQESLEVLRCLVEQSKFDEKWLERVNYKGLINLMRHGNCPIEIIQKIMIIIDHLIYIDSETRFSHEFVKNGQIISVIWSLKNKFQSYVMNILSNLAAFPQFRNDLKPYDHKICMMLKYENNTQLLYRFIYNRFLSQDFQIIEAIDELMLRVLAEAENSNERTVDIECLLWLRLLESNNGVVKVPQRIMGYDNVSANYIREKYFKNESQRL